MWDYIHIYEDAKGVPQYVEVAGVGGKPASRHEFVKDTDDSGETMYLAIKPKKLKVFRYEGERKYECERLVWMGDGYEGDTYEPHDTLKVSRVPSAEPAVQTAPVETPSPKQKSMRWIEALKIWNGRKGGAWCVPRKGTDEHAEVKAIMAAGKAEAAEMPKKDMKHEEAPAVAKNEIVEAPAKVRVASGPAAEAKAKVDLRHFMMAAMEKRKEAKAAAPKKTIAELRKELLEEGDSDDDEHERYDWDKPYLHLDVPKLRKLLLATKGRHLAMGKGVKSASVAKQLEYRKLGAYFRKLMKHANEMAK